MTKTEKTKYETFPPFAVYSCGLVGLELLDIQYGINDYIVYKYTGDDTIHRAKVNDSNTGFKSCIGYISFKNCMYV